MAYESTIWAVLGFDFAYTLPPGAFGVTHVLDHLKAQCDLRAHIEVFGARRAAERCAAGTRAPDLATRLDAVEAAARARDPAAFHRADWRLHRAVMDTSGIPTLRDAWQVVADALARFSRQSVKRHWPDLLQLADEHRFYVQAVLSGDAYAAEDAAATHLDGVWYRIAEERGEPGGEAKVDRRDPLQRAARDVSHVCPGHLSRLFQKRYGLGFQAYVQRLRMDKAAELLSRSSLPVNAVARRVGYADVSRFCQHFRRHAGSTPRAYRRGRAM